MGFLGFLKKKKEKRMLKPFSELEFPQMPPELFEDDNELEIPEPPEHILTFRSEKEIKSAPRFFPGRLPAEIKKVDKELSIGPKQVIFVKANNFRTIISEIRVSKTKLANSEQGIVNLAKIKILKDKEFEKYREYLEEIQRKLIFVDKTLFGG